MGSSSFFDTPNSGGSAYPEIDPVELQNLVQQAKDAAEDSEASHAASQVSATTSASSAAASLQSAIASEASHTQATTEANRATARANDAAASATASTNSATASQTSRLASDASASSASTLAGTATSQAGIATTKASDALTSANNAASSASAASTSATNAGASATNAANSATAANTSKVNAGTSETNAAASATAAAGSATTATNKATAASTSATNAATSETNALASKNAAATSATNAATSETNAASSASGALASYNSFRGAWYGPLAADPTLDPLGNAIGAGDAYWNTSTGLRIYNGTAWNAYSASGGAPTNSDYLVRTSDAGLSAERVVSDTNSVVWDWTTAGVAKANVQFASSIASSATKTAAYTVIASDNNGLIKLSGTFTLSFTAASTLGDKFRVFVRNTGVGTITLDPNGSELIDGKTTVDVLPGTGCWIACDGTALYTVGRSVEAHALAAAGYVRLASGLIIQWGNNVPGSVVFPVAFPTAVLRIIVGAVSTPSTVSGVIWGSQVSGQSGTGFTLTTVFNNGSTIGAAGEASSWIAMGY